MPKHNSKEPKFRCNFCKEYHYVPEYKTMHQCASHGYLCEKVVVTHESRIKLKFWENVGFIEREVSYPLKYIDFCNLEGNFSFGRVRTAIQVYDHYMKNYGVSINSTDQDVIDFWWNQKSHTSNKNQPDTYGCRKTIKYNWSDEFNLWIEEGNENVSLDKKPIQSLKNSNSNTEIKLLLDLFEKNILTKEQFVAQLKEKL